MVPLDENALRMRWFRSKARLNSWFALLALTVNFALSFGHVHVPGGNASDRGSIVAALASFDHGKARGHSNGSHPDDLCPICVASAALGNGLASTPPAILLQLHETVVDRTIAPVRLIATLHRAPFQSRGPPAA